MLLWHPKKEFNFRRSIICHKRIAFLIKGVTLFSLSRKNNNMHVDTQPENFPLILAISDELGNSLCCSCLASPELFWTWAPIFHFCFHLANSTVLSYAATRGKLCQPKDMFLPCSVQGLVSMVFLFSVSYKRMIVTYKCGASFSK